MILYIIRHADPDYAHDTITEFGKQEAAALAARMSRVRLDLIYTSPLGRAIATAKPTCDSLGITPEILPWTAESMDYMQMPDGKSGSFSFSFADGITSFDDFAPCERSANLTRLASESDALLSSLGYVRRGGVYDVTKPNDKRVAVFCHGGFGCAWISWLLGTPAGMGWQKIRLNTTSVTRFDFYNYESLVTVPVCTYLNDTSHIREAGLPNGR